MAGPVGDTGISKASATRPQKYDGIQGLRFFAALLVVVTHSFFYAGERLVPGFPSWPDGTVGVDIFFTISGFVMVVSSTRRIAQKDGWKYYSVRRIVRIVPMYWIATTLKVLIMVALPGAALHAALSPSYLLRSYLFLPARNVDGRVEPLLGVGWTLTFEMLFYLVFGIGLFLLAKNGIWFTSIIMISLAVGGFLRPPEWPTWAVYFNTIVFYFVVGMWLAKIMQLASKKRILWSISALCAIIGLALIVRSGELTLGSGTASRFALVVALVSAVLALEPWLEGRIPRVVLFFGNASYTLYLFHPMIAPIVPVGLGFFGVHNGWLSVLGSIAAALFASALIYRCVEQPLTQKLRGVSRYA